MVHKLIAASAAFCAVAMADFSYEQTSRITGGAMQSMMRVAGVFSKQAREPIKTTVMVKGDRMAMVTLDSINVIDLNAETFTEIDMKKKTYSVVTFAEMARAIEKAAAEARKKDNSGAEMSFRADVKHTGATKSIQGLDTKQAIVELTTEITDPNKKDQKAEMKMVMDMWLAPSITGYEEVRSFYTRMAQKASWNPMSGIAGAMMAGPSKGMNELVKEMSKIDGVPVYQVMRMGAMGGQGGEMAAAPQQEQQQPQQPAPNVGEAATGAAASAAAGRAGRLGGIAGGLGGLGGFGRRKKQEQQQEQPPQQQAPPPQAQQQTAPGQAPSLMELTSELSGFSSSVDASKFDVPAGFKKVDSERYKQ